MTAPKMTQQEARAEARRRWGENAYAIETEPAAWPERRYEVGVSFVDMRHPAVPRTKGCADSWEEAFRQADARSNEGR